MRHLATLILAILLIAPRLHAAGPTPLVYALTSSNATVTLHTNINQLILDLSAATGGATNGIQQLNGQGTNTTIKTLTAFGGANIDTNRVGSIISTNGPWADVIAYGADPSGAGDSTAAFLAAAALPNNNYILVPPGTFRITNTITLSRKHLIGSGRFNTIINVASNCYPFALTLTDNLIRDLSIQGTVDQTEIGALLFTNCTFSVVDNIYIARFTNGIYMTFAFGNSIRDVELYKVGNGIQLGAASGSAANNTITFSKITQESVTPYPGTKGIWASHGGANNITGGEIDFFETGIQDDAGYNLYNTIWMESILTNVNQTFGASDYIACHLVANNQLILCATNAQVRNLIGSPTYYFPYLPVVAQTAEAQALYLLNEGTGTSVNDVGPVGTNSATAQGQYSWVDGYVTKSLRLDGSGGGGNLKIPKNVISMASPWTFMALRRHVSGNAGDLTPAQLLHINDGTNYIRIDTHDHSLQVYTYNGTTVYSTNFASAQMRDGNWVWAAFTYDPANNLMTCLDTERGATPGLITNSLTGPVENINVNYSFAGVDEVVDYAFLGFWQRTLTMAEVESIQKNMGGIQFSKSLSSGANSTGTGPFVKQDNPLIGNFTTKDGTFDFGTGTGSATVELRGVTNANRMVAFKSGNVLRWQIGLLSGPEPGSDDGATFHFVSYTDAGSTKNSPLTISRFLDLVSVDNFSFATNLEQGTVKLITPGGHFTNVTDIASSTAVAQVLSGTNTEFIGGTTSEHAVITNGMTVNTNTLYVTNNAVGIGTAAPTHFFHIVTATNDAVAIDSTGTDSNSMLHILNTGVQGPFFDFHAANDRYGFGVGSLGAFDIRHSAVGTDPVNGTNVLTLDAAGLATLATVNATNYQIAGAAFVSSGGGNVNVTGHLVMGTVDITTLTSGSLVNTNAITTGSLAAITNVTTAALTVTNTATVSEVDAATAKIGTLTVTNAISSLTVTTANLATANDGTLNVTNAGTVGSLAAVTNVTSAALVGTNSVTSGGFVIKQVSLTQGVSPLANSTNQTLDFSQGMYQIWTMTNDVCLNAFSGSPSAATIKFRPNGANRNVLIDTNWMPVNVQGGALNGTFYQFVVTNGTTFSVLSAWASGANATNVAAVWANF